MATKTKKPLVVKSENSEVEIVFDFGNVDLFEFLGLMETSAQAGNGKALSAAETMGFIRVLRTAFVSSSRPLTVKDFEATIKAFWGQAELFKNPNA